MMHVGDIMSTVRVFSTGGDLLLFEYPHGTEHLHVTQDIPHVYYDIQPRYSRDPPHES